MCQLGDIEDFFWTRLMLCVWKLYELISVHKVYFWGFSYWHIYSLTIQFNKRSQYFVSTFENAKLVFLSCIFPYLFLITNQSLRSHQCISVRLRPGLLLEHCSSLILFFFSQSVADLMLYAWDHCPADYLFWSKL